MAEVHEQLLLDFDRPLIELYTPDEIYAEADESLVRALFEDVRLEKKPCSIHMKELGEYFSMWANTAPSGGLLVIGIKNDTQVEGCSNLSPDNLNRLEACGRDYAPDADYTVKRIPIHRDSDSSSDYLILFRVKYHPTRVVKTSDGKVYVRRADRLIQLRNPDEIHQLQEEKGEVRFETEPCKLEFPKQFNMRFVSEFTEAVRFKKGWDDQHTTEDILELMHLGKKEGSSFIPNIACALLFSVDPRLSNAGCRIRFLRFDGEYQGEGDKWNAVKDEFIDGTIPEQIVQAAAILKSQLRTFSRLEPSGKFFISPEYPEDAWYEAIVNASVHRSYGNGMRNMNIFVKMFDDRLEVESPGPFPPFVTPDTIYELHHPKNPFLMEAMMYLKFVKMAREGARRMKTKMQDMHLPSPEFKQDNTGHMLVRVTLRNNIKQRKVWVDSDVVALLGNQIALSLSAEQKQCINYCAEFGSINVSQAQRLTAHEWGTMKKMLMGLVARGIFDRVGRTDVDRDPKAKFVLRRISK